MQVAPAVEKKKRERKWEWETKKTSSPISTVSRRAAHTWHGQRADLFAIEGNLPSVLE